MSAKTMRLREPKAIPPDLVIHLQKPKHLAIDRRALRQKINQQNVPKRQSGEYLKCPEKTKPEEQVQADASDVLEAFQEERKVQSKSDFLMKIAAPGDSFAPDLNSTLTIRS
jgi:hypothetical protein